MLLAHVPLPAAGGHPFPGADEDDSLQQLFERLLVSSTHSAPAGKEAGARVSPREIRTSNLDLLVIPLRLADHSSLQSFAVRAHSTSAAGRRCERPALTHSLHGRESDTCRFLHPAMHACPSIRSVPPGQSNLVAARCVCVLGAVNCVSVWALVSGFEFGLNAPPCACRRVFELPRSEPGQPPAPAPTARRNRPHVEARLHAAHSAERAPIWARSAPSGYREYPQSKSKYIHNSKNARQQQNARSEVTIAHRAACLRSRLLGSFAPPLLTPLPLAPLPLALPRAPRSSACRRPRQSDG